MKSGKLILTILVVLLLCGMSIAEIPQDGLVSYWDFDIDATDLVGSNDGTLYGDASIVGDIARGTCLSLDGDGDYVSCGDIDEIDIEPNRDITWMCWLKITPSSDTEMVLDKRQDSSGWVGLGIWKTHDNSLAAKFYPGDSWSTGVSVNGDTRLDGSQWHHLAVSCDRDGVMALYLDGQFEGSVDISAFASLDLSNDAEFTIGNASDDASNYGCFNGNIDEVAVYSSVVSAQEIQDIYDAGLVEMQGEVYHVDVATGDNGNNGLSRETAFETIQYAINKASDGDTVLVWPGVYNEDASAGISFQAKAITVKSAADAAVLEVPGGYAVSFVGNEGAQSVLSNFVIKNSGIAVFAFYSAPTITNLTIVDNENGIFADNAEPDITNCIFWNNSSSDLFGMPDQIEARYSYMGNAVEIEPVSVWTFDNNANDSIGDNDGVIYGAQWATGKTNNALEFDGFDDYVEVAHDDSLNVTNAITICAWIKTNETIATQTIISKSPGATPNYSIEIPRQAIGGGVRFFGYESGSPKGITAYGGTPVTDGNWHHIAATFDGTDWVIYDNAETYKTRTESANLTTSNQQLLIGKRDHEDRLFKGIIDEVQIYNQVLSIEEIRDIYETGVANHLGPLFADANAGDYHLLSERGRYRATTDEWILDDVTSPCVDGGDPAVEPTNERMPNGGRMNIGAYGNTFSASMSEWPLKADLDFDGVVNFEDFAVLANDWLKVLEFAPNPDPEPEIDNEPPMPNPSQ